MQTCPLLYASECGPSAMTWQSIEFERAQWAFKVFTSSGRLPCPAVACSRMFFSCPVITAINGAGVRCLYFGVRLVYFFVFFQGHLAIGMKGTKRKGTFPWLEVTVNSTLMRSHSRSVVMFVGALHWLHSTTMMNYYVDAVRLGNFDYVMRFQIQRRHPPLAGQK